MQLEKASVLEIHNVGWSRTAVYLLADYLRERSRMFVHVAYPVVRSKDLTPIFDVYLSGRRVYSLNSRTSRVDWLSYASSSLWIILKVLRFKKRFNLLIAGDELNAFIALIFKAMGLTDKVVFYSIDFDPYRFSHPMANGLLWAIGGVVVRNCDYVWNISHRCREARIRQGGNPRNLLIVPHGVVRSNVRPNFTEGKAFHSHQIVFVGSLTQEKGVQLAIEAMTYLRKKLPDVKLIVIGDGPYKDELRRMVSALDLNSHVQFMGYLSEADKNAVIQQSSVGVATFVPPSPRSYLYYAFPGKVVEYLALGVPVVCTDLGLAGDIQRENAGLMVDYDVVKLANALFTLLSDERHLQALRENARRFSQQFDAEYIFEVAFQHMF